MQLPDFMQMLDDHMSVTLFLGIGSIVLIGSVLKAVTAVVTGASRERSRREIAAYVAEGSMTAEQAERLMKAESTGTKVCWS